MPSVEFSFAVTLLDGRGFEPMLGTLTATALEQAGCPPAEAESILATFREAFATAPGAEAAPCEARLSCQGGVLEIVVSYAGRPDWRVARPLP